LQKRVALWIVFLVWIGLACNLTPGITPPAADNPVPDTSAAAGTSPTEKHSLPTYTATPLLFYERFLCEKKPSTVALFVNPGLADAVRSGLDQFEADLCDDGYSVVERTLDFASPTEVRAYLADLYLRSARQLEGAIFIGEVPLAYQWVQAASSNPENQPAAQEVISFQYYSDLDGEFSASDEYHSPDGQATSFDQHTGETDWEIWIGILPMYQDDDAETVKALTRYFEKNHRYRTGGYSIPQGFLQINEHYWAKNADEQAALMDGMRSGPYAWTPLSSAPGARLYINGTTLSIQDGYADLSAGEADITVTETHGDHTRSGVIGIDWVESRPVRTVLFWTDGCSVGDLAYPQNFLTSIVYSPTSEVLAAKGSTNDSGGLGTNAEGFYGHNVAVRLVAGKNLGQAILGHVNIPLIAPWSESREFHFSMLILIGDPTLRLRG
jgi:hypothetical protein